jgi:hypothetical protein
VHKLVIIYFTVLMNNNIFAYLACKMSFGTLLCATYSICCLRAMMTSICVLQLDTSCLHCTLTLDNYGGTLQENVLSCLLCVFVVSADFGKTSKMSVSCYDDENCVDKRAP